MQPRGVLMHSKWPGDSSQSFTLQRSSEPALVFPLEVEPRCWGHRLSPPNYPCCFVSGYGSCNFYTSCHVWVKLLTYMQVKWGRCTQADGMKRKCHPRLIKRSSTTERKSETLTIEDINLKGYTGTLLNWSILCIYTLCLAYVFINITISLLIFPYGTCRILVVSQDPIGCVILQATYRIPISVLQESYRIPIRFLQYRPNSPVRNNTVQ